MTSDESDDEADASPPDVPRAPNPGGPDPDDLGPDAPSVPNTGSEDLGPSIPTPPEPGDADSEVVGLFWKLVLVFNVAVFGITVGPMFGYFLGDWELGLQVFLVGALAFAYGTFRYYRFRKDRDRGDDSEN